MTLTCNTANDEFTVDEEGVDREGVKIPQGWNEVPTNSVQDK